MSLCPAPGVSSRVTDTGCCGEVILGQDHNLRGARPQGQESLSCLATCNLGSWPPRACTRAQGQRASRVLDDRRGLTPLGVLHSPLTQQSLTPLQSALSSSHTYLCVLAHQLLPTHPPPYTCLFIVHALPSLSILHAHSYNIPNTYALMLCIHGYTYTHTHALHTGLYAPHTCTHVRA